MADTQMAKAKKGELTPEMEAVALQEGLEPEALMEKVASGRVVIPANVNHRGLTPRGIGEGLRVKVNANIGTSSDQTDLEEELRKLFSSKKVKKLPPGLLIEDRRYEEEVYIIEP